MDVSQTAGAQDSRNGSEAEDELIYVEELAGAEDYWLSITDAARVCRVQDVSIRRAITRKVLPVRRQRAGQNKRTRFVRASDLAPAGFPIIDESAAITTQVGKVDILSIPQQQQQITKQHQELQGHLNELRVQYEQIDAALHQQQTAFQAALGAVREEHRHTLASAEQHLTREQANLRLALTEHLQELAEEQQAQRQDLLQEQASAFARDKHLQTATETLRQEFAQAHTDALARDERLHTSLLEQRQALEQRLTALTRQQQTTHDQLNQELRRVEQETQASLRTLEEQLTAQLQQTTRRFDARLADLAHALAGLQHTSENTRLALENLRQSTTQHEQEHARSLQQHQARLEQLEQLLPLLPYVGQTLATGQDLTAGSRALADLEARWQREQARYQPLLQLLTPERLAPLINQPVPPDEAAQ